MFTDNISIQYSQGFWVTRRLIQKLLNLARNTRRVNTWVTQPPLSIQLKWCFTDPTPPSGLLFCSVNMKTCVLSILGVFPGDKQSRWTRKVMFFGTQNLFQGSLLFDFSTNSFKSREELIENQISSYYSTIYNPFT